MARFARRSLRLAIAALEQLGLTVARRKDYYSPLPSASELRRTAERWNRPSELPGVHYDLERMKELLAQLAADYGGAYNALPPFDQAKRMGYGPGFTRVDAQTLYFMLRHLKPRRYIEVGSGLSTWYASQALAHNQAAGAPPCSLTCIDPFADPALSTLANLTLRREPVQETPFELFATLGGGDVLFIDSTHVVRIDGDVPFLYLEVLPRLAPGVVVHSHDIHFPYNVPHPAQTYVLEAGWPRYWTEAMLLQAFLCGNRDFEIVLSTPLLRHFDEGFLERTLKGYRPVENDDYDSHFGSLWYRRRPLVEPS